MSTPRIRHVRASVVRGGGADYHDQAAGHWIDDHIATPMAKYPEYRQSRQSFGINVLGTLVVEVEADDGTTGFAVTTGGELGAWIVEKHLARFVEGQLVTDVEKIWDQMYLVDPVLRPQGHRAQHHQRRRPGAVGPARPGPPGARLPPARRSGPRRADLLRHRGAARSGQGDGLHRRQDAAAARPRRARGGAAREHREAAHHARAGRRRLLADVRLLDVAGPRLRHAAGAPGVRSTG